MVKVCPSMPVRKKIKDVKTPQTGLIWVLQMRVFLHSTLLTLFGIRMMAVESAHNAQEMRIALDKTLCKLHCWHKGLVFWRMQCSGPTRIDGGLSKHDLRL